MEIIKMDEVQGKINPKGILAKILLKNKDVTVTNIVLEPGKVVPEHSVPVNVFFYVVEGKGTMRIGEEEAVVKEKDIIVCPENTNMHLRADQDEKFVVLNVKTPSLK